MSEINVTPLVDVMLVLLVIFIVCAPLMAQALRVDLPQVKADAAAEADRVTVEVGPGGSFFLDGTETGGAAALTARLTERLAADPDLVVELAADGEAAYQRVAEAIALLREAGAARVAFATSPPPRQ